MRWRGWARALYLVGGDLSFDESALGFALGWWQSFLLVAFSGSFVHRCRRSPAFGSLITASSEGKWPRFIGDLAQLVARSLDAVGRVYDAPEHRREVQEGSESLPGPLAGRHRLGVLDPNIGLGEVGQGLPGGLLARGGADRP